MLAVIRVLTTQDENLLNAHGRIITAKYGLPTRSYCIPDQPEGIYNEETERIAVPKIVRLARQAEEEGAKAIFISCAADPALQEVRAECKIPVIGAGSAAAAVALALGRRIGVLNLTEATPAAVAAVLGAHMVAEARPEGVKNTRNLLTPAGKEKAVKAAGELVSKGADVIVFACTGYSTIGLAGELRGRLGVRIVDAVEAGGVVARYTLQN
ncbi:aspartate/glutamate racemase family protein [Neomoorella mulderi]|uniref:Glutamate racemase n=1 Tax=Moorella mulderi DSM 14980 TaxID=1122241 RepID=A0A151AV33_9FIRM|nr:aspartate/glutamate racemase family protein [Moorella mulderi]KYH31423.1 glutamate racemase [Moorella mulderi DSM 14980]